MFAVKAPFSCPKSSEVTVSKFMSVSATLTKGPSALAQQINQDIDDDFQGMGHIVGIGTGGLRASVFSDSLWRSAQLPSDGLNQVP